MQSILAWLGFAAPKTDGHAGDAAHAHTHGVIDSTLVSTTQGIWAIKWSFIILGVTSILQLIVVYESRSVALFADAIHNVGDAGTAIPLWIAFMLARRAPSERFTYGYGRAEDLAGIGIVLIILFSALVAAYEAIQRLIHPQAITLLGWVAVAGVIGFIGNEVVAVFRIRIGRKINSAALIADGYHARTDGLTSLAVVLGAFGVWLGYPLADPIVGLLITVAIFGIVWQSAKAVLTRVLDGVDAHIPNEIRRAIEPVPGIREIIAVRARWLGHRLNAEIDLAVDGGATLKETDLVSAAVSRAALSGVAELAAVRVYARAAGADSDAETVPAADPHDSHHHAPAPFVVQSRFAEGVLQIIGIPAGERMLLRTTRAVTGLLAEVSIQRTEGRIEILQLYPMATNTAHFTSRAAPEEPHEFDAVLRLGDGENADTLAFHMAESKG